MEGSLYLYNYTVIVLTRPPIFPMSNKTKGASLGDTLYIHT